MSSVECRGELLPSEANHLLTVQYMQFLSIGLTEGKLSGGLMTRLFQRFDYRKLKQKADEEANYLNILKENNKPPA